MILKRSAPFEFMACSNWPSSTSSLVWVSNLVMDISNPSYSPHLDHGHLVTVPPDINNKPVERFNIDGLISRSLRSICAGNKIEYVEGLKDMSGDKHSGPICSRYRRGQIMLTGRHRFVVSQSSNGRPVSRPAR